MTPSESFAEVAGGKIQMLQAGAGRPLLVLHHEIGNPGWLPFYDDLARDFTVHVPSHPGFGKSERPEWMRTVRDTGDGLSTGCVNGSEARLGRRWSGSASADGSRPKSR